MKSIRSRRARGVVLCVAMAMAATTLSWVAAVTPASAAATETSFSYALDPASGGIDTGSSTPADGEFRVTGTAGHVQAFIDTPQGFWLFQFRAQHGTQLVPGSYSGAKRFASADNPGLDVGGRWSCYDGTGSLRVHAITSDEWGDIAAFDVSFEQTCGTAPDVQTFRAALRYNAPVAAPVVVTASSPTTIEMQPATFTALVARGEGGPATGTVSFLDGSIVIGSAPVVDGLASFTTTTLAIGVHDVVASYQGDATHPPATSAPVAQTVRDSRMSMWIASESGDYIGQGATRSWTVPTSQFAIESWDPNQVGFTIHAPSGTFNLRFAAVAGHALTTGTYVDATSAAPYHDTTRPGLSVSGDGAGCDGRGGQFVVEELRRDSNGHVLVFAATFEHRCSHLVAGLHGRVRYAASTKTTITGGPWWLDYGQEDREPYTIQVTSTKPEPPTGTVTLTDEDGAPVCTTTLSGGLATCTLGPKQLLPGAYLLKATYTPDTGALRPSTSYAMSVQIWHGQTTLAVDPARASDVAATGRLTYRARLTARLTGEPLAARVVSFAPIRPLGAGTGTGVGECSGVTDAAGWATCSVPASEAGASASGFHAEWEGDDRYYWTSTNAAFVA